MTDRELMQMALDALEDVGDEWGFTSQRTLPKRMNVIEALRARLAQPEPEPVAWMHDSHVGFNVPLFTAPPQREWQGLTDEEIMKITGITSADSDWNVTIVHKWIRSIEERLKEKNHEGACNRK